MHMWFTPHENTGSEMHWVHGPYSYNILPLLFTPIHHRYMLNELSRTNADAAQVRDALGVPLRVGTAVVGGPLGLVLRRAESAEIYRR
jgi:hypothetical protein